MISNKKQKNIMSIGFDRSNMLQVSSQQTGIIKSIKRDSNKKAKLPGKRISKTGKIYTENRINRSDLPNGL